MATDLAAMVAAIKAGPGTPVEEVRVGQRGTLGLVVEVRRTATLFHVTQRDEATGVEWTDSLVPGSRITIVG
jgi:hypothetical protein